MSSNFTPCNYGDTTNCTYDIMPGRRSYWALALLMIPICTLLGNLLVIISVVTRRSLHSPINFFILGLAMADLCVALAVMPFAVYVEFNEHWELGTLLCDLYCAADVTCSTASIFLLTVISFDRYVAATQPIQYANNAKGIKRVAVINLAVWLVSLLIASPMVLGLNNVPERDTSKCMFYNADFLIYSSTGSFCIPLVIIIYLYARIYCVIRQRGRFAQKRHDLLRYSITQEYDTRKSISINSIRLPSIIEYFSPAKDQSTGLTEKKAEHKEQHTQPSSSNSGKAVFEVQTDYEPPKYNQATVIRSYSNPAIEKHSERVFSRSNSLELLNRPVPEYCAIIRKSSSWPNLQGITDSIYGSNCSLRQFQKRVGKHEEKSKEKSKGARNSVTFLDKSNITSICTQESLLISLSGRLSHKGHTTPVTHTNPQSTPASTFQRTPMNPMDTYRRLAMTYQGTSTSTLGTPVTARSSYNRSPALVGPSKALDTLYKPLLLRRVDSELNKSFKSKSNKKRSFDDGANKYRNRFLRRISTTVLLWRSQKEHVLMNTREIGDDTTTSNTEKDNVRQPLLLHTDKRLKSPRKSASKSQRKEKKATKTLAIVLGVFLICWLPFFTLNLLNAMCIKLRNPSCQVGFLPFFLTTWLGYMNSLMNPIIYTIFNADFRRAFKEILCAGFMKKRPTRRI